MMADPFFKNGVTGRHVLVWMLAFFGVIIVTDAYLVYKAVSTFGGVETRDAYRRGLTYNTRIAEEERQAALGWSHDVTIADDGERLEVMLRDATGAPIDGVFITALLGRPATNAHDQEVQLTAVGNGRYASPVRHLDPGVWIAALVVRQGESGDSPIVYQSKVRLWKAP